MRASRSGTNDSLMPNRPVFTLTHSGVPVASSRNTCFASPILAPSASYTGCSNSVSICSSVITMASATFDDWSETPTTPRLPQPVRTKQKMTKLTAYRTFSLRPCRRVPDGIRPAPERDPGRRGS